MVATKQKELSYGQRLEIVVYHNNGKFIVKFVASLDAQSLLHLMSVKNLKK